MAPHPYAMASALTGSGDHEVSVHDKQMCDDFDAAFPPSTTSGTSLYKALFAFYHGATAPVPTALMAESNAAAYHGRTYGPRRPYSSRLPPHKRFRKGAEHTAGLELRKHRRAEEEPGLLEAVGDAVPSLWGCDVQTFGENGLSDAAVRKRRKLSRYLRDEGGPVQIVGGDEPVEAEEPDDFATAATAATADVTDFSLALDAAFSGSPRIAPVEAYPAPSGSGFGDENAVPVPGASEGWNNALHPPLLPEEDLPPLSQAEEEFMQSLVDMTQGVYPTPPPDLGVAAAAELLKSLDLGSIVPVSGEVPATVGLVAEGPAVESGFAQQEQGQSMESVSMDNFLEMPVPELHTQSGQQLANLSAEQLRPSQPLDQSQQQQAPQNPVAQQPQPAWGSSLLAPISQQGPGQGQQVPFFPATVPLQQPANGPPVALPQQPPQWFDASQSATANNAPPAGFPPQQPAPGYMSQQPFNDYQPLQSYTTWTDPGNPMNRWVCFFDPSQGRFFWRSLLTGAVAAAMAQVPQPQSQPPRGPRGGLLRVAGRPRVSTPAGSVAAGSGSQAQPSPQTSLDPATLATGSQVATGDQPGQPGFIPLMSGALRGSPGLETE